MTERVSFRVTDTEAGERLDKVLVAREPDLSRRVAAQLCAGGAVRVDGRVARKGELAQAGTFVEYARPEVAWARPDGDAPLSVVLERADLVVVDKAAGQPTAPRGRDEGGSVASGLVFRYPEMANVGHGPLEPGLVHRLDTHTSGLLVAARTPAAFVALKRLLTTGRLDKRYLAVVMGADLPDEGHVTTPIAPHPRSAKRVVTGADLSLSGARAAGTRFHVVRRNAAFALCEIHVSCAVRHQIRVHLASLGHPLVGDVTYGGEPHPALGSSHALHASYIAWDGDDTVAGFAVEAALPVGMGVLMGG